MVQLTQHKSDPSIICYKFYEDISTQDIEFMSEMNSVFSSQYGEITVFVNVNKTPIIDLNTVTLAAKSANNCKSKISRAVIFNLVGFNLVFAYNMQNMLRPYVREKFKIFATKQECEAQSELRFDSDFVTKEEPQLDQL